MRAWAWVGVASHFGLEGGDSERRGQPEGVVELEAERGAEPKGADQAHLWARTAVLSVGCMAAEVGCGCVAVDVLTCGAACGSLF